MHLAPTDLKTVGPQIRARMDRAIHRGHPVAPPPVKTPADRVNETFERIMADLEALKDLPNYASYRQALSDHLARFRAGWHVLLRLQPPTDPSVPKS